MLVRKKAPMFAADAIMPNSDVIGKFVLQNHFGKNGTVVFFYPKDFTFVCPSEIIAFNNKFNMFDQKGFTLVGISTDSILTHQSWVRLPSEKGGIGKIKFPLVSDKSRKISKKYGVWSRSEKLALRGSFLIDRNGIVCHCVINDFPLGRSIDEMLRMIDALLFFEENGEVCPANWKVGKKAIKPTKSGVIEFLTNNAGDLE